MRSDDEANCRPCGHFVEMGYLEVNTSRLRWVI